MLRKIWVGMVATTAIMAKNPTNAINYCLLFIIVEHICDFISEKTALTYKS